MMTSAPDFCVVDDVTYERQGNPPVVMDRQNYPIREIEYRKRVERSSSDD